MLPEPTSSFTIPSIHDDLSLDCRIYHPKQFSGPGSGRQSSWSKKGAILAHPYAPLGGCFDDPVIDSAASEILKHGFVVGTFNFRGAAGSKGRTSWTGHPEQDDYVSFVGFFLHYLHNLCPPGSAAVSPSSPNGHLLSPIQSNVFEQVSSTACVVIGGYSYGSLIAINLPPIETIMAQFDHTVKGTAQAEIRLRAFHVSGQWNMEAKEAHESRHRGRPLVPGSSPRRASAVVFGGEESEPGTRRPSHESHRSLDAVRRSFDASRLKRGLGKGKSREDMRTAGNEELPFTAIPIPKICYLLISPLLPPISAFLTMFSGLPFFHRAKSERSPEATSRQDKLWRNRSLAVYGDKDFFTSHKKLREWSKRLTAQPGSLFQFYEIAGAGHFWHEEGAERRLRTILGEWLDGPEVQ